MPFQQLILCWNDHNRALVSVFAELLKTNTLVDCTLAAGGQYLKAHKVVLSACSPYFELLFAQESEKNPIVILKDVEFQELKAAVNFIYKGEVDICEDRLEAFLEVAEALQIKGLKSDGETQNSEEKSSSLLVEILSAKAAETAQQESMKNASSSHSDGPGQSSNVDAGGEAVGNDEKSAVHQSFRSEGSCSSPTLPPSTSISPRKQDTCHDKVIVENNHDSSAVVPQFSPRENEQSDLNSAIKTEPETDAHVEVKSEEVDMDCGDDSTKMDVQENCEKRYVNTMSEPSTSQLDLGAECVIEQNSQQTVVCAPQLCNSVPTGGLSNFNGSSAESFSNGSVANPSEIPQTLQQPESGKHICLQCQNVFSSSRELAKHMRSHDNNIVHKCPYCDYTSAKSSAMTYHSRTHSLERPYKCPHCIHRSKTNVDLSRHIRTHTGRSPTNASNVTRNRKRC